MPPEKPQVDLQRSRCPYCHDAIAPGPGIRGCGECLSWQHESCWSEHGECGACGADAAGQRRAPAADSAPRAVRPDDVLSPAPDRASPHGGWPFRLPGQCLEVDCSEPICSWDTPFYKRLKSNSPLAWASDDRCANHTIASQLRNTHIGFGLSATLLFAAAAIIVINWPLPLLSIGLFAAAAAVFSFASKHRRSVLAWAREHAERQEIARAMMAMRAEAAEQRQAELARMRDEREQA